MCCDPRLGLGIENGARPHQIQETAKSLANTAREQGYQLFCGRHDMEQREHELFAISGVHPCQLIRDFRVGSHNRGWADAEESEVRSVRPDDEDLSGQVIPSVLR